MGYTTNADGKKEKMACCEVPVMAILKEFRAMADGVRGRKAHRPTGIVQEHTGIVQYKFGVCAD